MSLSLPATGASALWRTSYYKNYDQCTVRHEMALTRIFLSYLAPAYDTFCQTVAASCHIQHPDVPRCLTLVCKSAVEEQTSTLTTDRRRSNSVDHISNYSRAIQRCSTNVHRENWPEAKPSKSDAYMTHWTAYELSIDNT